MEQEFASDYQNKTEKIYKEREIWVGALLGGTLAAGFMIARNFRAFGETEKILKTWIVTVAATVFLILISFAPFVDRLPNFLFPLVCAGIIITLTQIYQGAQIRRHIRAGGKIQSWWKTIGISIVALVVTLILMISAAFVVTFFEGSAVTSKTYGNPGNEIYYNKDNISEGEIDRVADALIKSEIFRDEGKKMYAFVNKAATDYEIFFSIDRKYLNNAEVLEFYKELRDRLQTSFPNNKIIINLVTDSFDKIEKRIE